ncbi:(deoxy)nucleoside triphosphate pyrophosphohydrolase [Sphingomonas oligophenolica]|uniref:8-oxo-dGTP diphosphatase n=1 Tax=Sphingomonas oligophenolica TaxID=301154 RepID=A0A502CSC9_9SPHN|nr:(deoxy)nucleoside triphosphate pyrophosphohydrolase [Sphingomonas oligophenolica]
MLVVAIALVAADGRVLLAQRPRGSRHGGLWEFPGGKVESGERPEAALVREVREELGIEIDPRDLAPVGFASEAEAKRHLLLLLYRADRWVGEPTALVADRLAWVAVEAMPALAMPPADRPLVEALARPLDRP